MVLVMVESWRCLPGFSHMELRRFSPPPTALGAWKLGLKWWSEWEGRMFTNTCLVELSGNIVIFLHFLIPNSLQI